jgi:VIT1/CCC1 family predicted Fe2+/Mn2+ transporter
VSFGVRVALARGFLALVSVVELVLRGPARATRWRGKSVLIGAGLAGATVGAAVGAALPGALAPAAGFDVDADAADGFVAARGGHLGSYADALIGLVGAARRLRASASRAADGAELGGDARQRSTPTGRGR